MLASFARGLARVALAVFTGYAATALDNEARPLRVTAPLVASPVDLDETKPGLRRIGRLRYKAGWSLTSPHKLFGGISGMVLKGDKVRAVTDAGVWLDIPIGPGTVPAGTVTLQPFTADKVAKNCVDAESLLKSGSGYLVAFEQKHRLEQSMGPGSPFEPAAYSAKLDLRRLPKNRGLEAMTWLADKRLMLIAEGGQDARGAYPVWITDGRMAERLKLSTPENFRPTDAALLPGGDVLILLRYFSPLDGVAVKLVRIATADIQAGVTLVGEEILHLAPPMTVDNMEALAVGVGDDGVPLILMMSDDNFSRLQRTLLMVFELLP